MSSSSIQVSIITPVYNGADHLPRVINSVCNQDGDFSYEHIIIDDGSSDSTAAVLEEWSDRDDKLLCLFQPNRGAGAARNLGIEAASGRYIAFLDSDDLWLPGKLLAQIGFMQSKRVAFSHGDYEQRNRQTGASQPSFVAPDQVSYRDLLHSCPIGCLTAAYDQEALGKVYMPDVRRGQDWGLWLALTRKGGPAHKYPGVHAVYHAGGNSLSTNKLAKLRDIYAIYREQEALGVFASGWYLAHHAASAMRKQR
ncbi:glycosyltransferase family 2 protein [Halomonas salipaludis]|uniref:Glycosyl transferase n=1 Tax=Halomonas salipaludis TaxID=2032625 RepID=A0A2A2F1Y2_9GAMM|nr:glycosyltransferase family 2 protein [Halomonas salipaludis]PAU79456.1 glycosyl transferase [Halomonas salipaludis]